MTYKKFLAIVLVIVSAAYFSGVIAQTFRFQPEKTATAEISPLPQTEIEGDKCVIKTSLPGHPTISIAIDQIREQMKSLTKDEKWLTITGKDKNGKMVHVSVSYNQLRGCL